jgi:hypothetical protein
MMLYVKECHPLWEIRMCRLTHDAGWLGMWTRCVAGLAVALIHQGKYEEADKQLIQAVQMVRAHRSLQ